MAENTRVEIGFVGGGATSASLDDAACKKLLKAMDKGDDDVVELPGDSGALHIRVSQVAWVRVHSKDARVGF